MATKRKKYKNNKKQTPRGKYPSSQYLLDDVSIPNRAERLFPYVVVGVYVIIMGVASYMFHTVGGLDVENDFYAELYPSTKKLLSGDFSPLNYASKGPVYSFLLAGMYGFIRDYFKAGQALNLLSVGVFLLMGYHTLKRLFNSLTAAFALVFAVTNYFVMTYTYQVGSDMPFLMFCALALFFLFRDDGRADIVFSGFFALCAFLTRYNGVFLVGGALLYYLTKPESFKSRLIDIGAWCGIFLLAGLPWFVINTYATGNPVFNTNYENVMLEFYGRGSVSDGLWRQSLPKEFTSLGDIFLYDPVYFIGHWAENLLMNFIADMDVLLGWHFGVFVVAGIPLLYTTAMTRRRVLFYIFALFYMMILALVFYNPRFSLLLVIFYVPLAAYPLTEGRLLKWLGKARWAPFALMIALMIPFVTLDVRAVADEIQRAPVFLKTLGEQLKKKSMLTNATVLARTPHIAYYAGMKPRVFPGHISTVQGLVAWCIDENIDYIAYSIVEQHNRPELDELMSVDREFNFLERVVVDPHGVIYRITK